MRGIKNLLRFFMLHKDRSVFKRKTWKGLKNKSYTWKWKGKFRIDSDRIQKMVTKADQISQWAARMRVRFRLNKKNLIFPSCIHYVRSKMDTIDRKHFVQAKSKNIYAQFNLKNRFQKLYLVR